MQLELIRWVGVGFVIFALVLAMVDSSRESDEGSIMLLMAGSGVVLLAGIGYLAPDLLLGLTVVFNAGSWLFYLIGIIAPVYFASRMLVIG
jgi:hypothetical protein